MTEQELKELHQTTFEEMMNYWLGIGFITITAGSLCDRLIEPAGERLQGRPAQNTETRQCQE